MLDERPRGGDPAAEGSALLWRTSPIGFQGEEVTLTLKAQQEESLRILKAKQEAEVSLEAFVEGKLGVHVVLLVSFVFCVIVSGMACLRNNWREQRKRRSTCSRRRTKYVRTFFSLDCFPRRQFRRKKKRQRFY